MRNTEKEVASQLLQIKAIKLNPSNPFTWASGWKSPIYCDNRKILSYPEIRSFIVESFTGLVKEKYPDVEVIAGVATGAIAFGALVADRLNLPFVYVRPAPKAHGMGNQVEGEIFPGQKTLVIEDLISTGQSSLNALEALRSIGADVQGMLAVFSYGFAAAEDNFKQAGCKLDTLSNYKILLETALEAGYVKQMEIETLNEWRKNPSEWKQNK
jgi:orotate phosphoribosyltransferase